MSFGIISLLYTAWESTTQDEAIAIKGKSHVMSSVMYIRNVRIYFKYINKITISYISIIISLKVFQIQFGYS